MPAPGDSPSGMRPLTILIAVFVGILGLVLGYDIATTIPPQPTEAFDPKEIRIISAQEITSTCIGDPKTPICATETLLACWSLKKIELCDMVGEHGTSLNDPASTHRYQIKKYRNLTQRDAKLRFGHTNWSKPGIVWIDIYDIEFAGRKCLEECRQYFSLVQTDSGWQIASWTTDRDSI